MLSAPCLTGGSVRGDEKKLHFLEKKPEKYFVSSRNCRTFALAFGKFSGAGLENGVFEARKEEVIFDILQTTTRQQSAFPCKGVEVRQQSKIRRFIYKQNTMDSDRADLPGTVDRQF